MLGDSALSSEAVFPGATEPHTAWIFYFCSNPRETYKNLHDFKELFVPFTSLGLPFCLSSIVRDKGLGEVPTGSNPE